jgi:hypothetical protein
MLRIERVQNGNGTVLRAAGRLTGPWVAELDRAVATEPGAFLLDLTDVTFADHDGLALLQSFVAARRVPLRCGAFLSEQLSTASKATP